MNNFVNLGIIYLIENIKLYYLKIQLKMKEKKYVKGELINNFFMCDQLGYDFR